MPSTESTHVFLADGIQACQKHTKLLGTLLKGSENKCIWFIFLLRKVQQPDNAFALSFCSRFKGEKKNISCSLESFLFLTCDKMKTLMFSFCLHIGSTVQFDLVFILHGGSASSHVSQPPHSTQKCLSTISTSIL